MSMDVVHDYPFVMKSGAFESLIGVMTVCKIANAPIDRVKLLIQNEGTVIKTEPYKGFHNCLLRTVRDEGFASLWRGSIVNVIRYVPLQALNFMVYEVCKCECNKIWNKDECGYWWWSAGNVAAGFCTGVYPIGWSHLIVYSMEYARTRLALDVNKGRERQFKGVVDVWKKTLVSDGWARVYRGFWASFLGNTVYRGLYFGMYDSLKPVVLTGTMKDSFCASFALAWMMATAAGFVTYPLDTIRRRIMMMSGEHRSIYVAAVKNHGSLYKGVGANILRATTGAALLAAFDKLKIFRVDYGDWV